MTEDLLLNLPPGSLGAGVPFYPSTEVSLAAARLIAQAEQIRAGIVAYPDNAVIGVPVGGGGGDTSVLLMSDTFTTNRIAGAVNGTAAEPGPDDTRTVLDTLGGISLSSGNLAFNNVRTANGDPAIQWKARTRTAGMGLIAKVTTGDANSMVLLGFDETGTTNAREGIHIYNKLWARENSDAAHSVFPTDPGTYYLVVLLQATGYHSFIKGGIYTNLTRNWRSWWGNTASVRPTIAKTYAAGNAATSWPELQLRQFNGSLATDAGLAMLSVATAVSATEYTATNASDLSPGDFEAVLTVTASNPLDGDANTRTGLYYRADTDLTPAWHAYFDGTGAVRLDSIAADGTRTNRVNVAAAITAGATRTIKVLCRGSKHNLFTAADAITSPGKTFTLRGAEVDVSLNDDVTTVTPVAAAGWTLGKLEVYPQESLAFAPINDVLNF